MSGPKFSIGDFALVQGQVVEILDRRIQYNDIAGNYFTYRVKLLDTRLTNWLNEPELLKIENQATPKVLYSKP